MIIYFSFIYIFFDVECASCLEGYIPYLDDESNTKCV